MSKTPSGWHDDARHLAGGTVMTNTQRGEAHRKVIRDLLLVQGGQPLPSSHDLGWLLGIDHKAALKHLTATVIEDGRSMIRRGQGKGRRLYLAS